MSLCPWGLHIPPCVALWHGQQTDAPATDMPVPIDTVYQANYWTLLGRRSCSGQNQGDSFLSMSRDPQMSLRYVQWASRGLLRGLLPEASASILGHTPHYYALEDCSYTSYRLPWQWELGQVSRSPELDTCFPYVPSSTTLDKIPALHSTLVISPTQRECNESSTAAWWPKLPPANMASSESSRLHPSSRLEPGGNSRNCRSLAQAWSSPNC